MSNNFVIADIERPSRGLIESFGDIPVANISDALGKPNRRTIDPYIRPAFNGVHLAGSAITVKEMPCCNLMTHMSIDLAKSGDVIMIDVGGSIDAAVGGFLMSRKMISKDLAGVVVDGAWRDRGEIVQECFPVYARAWQPSGPHKDLPGSVNIPICCGGVVVQPGDIVVGDDDGVVVVPRIDAMEVLAKARDIMRREISLMEEKRKEVIEQPSKYATKDRLESLGMEFR